MKDGVLIHDSADKVPPAPAGRHPLTPVSGADFHKPGLRLPAQAWLILTVACLVPLLLALWGLYGVIEHMILLYPWLIDVLGFALFAAFLGVIVGTPIAAGFRLWIGTMHARVVRTAHGAMADVVTVMGVTQQVAEGQQAALIETMAVHNQFATPNLSTLSAPGGKPAEKGAEVPALPAPTVGLIPSSEWLNWIDQTPHLMIAGRTNAGKTTLATAVLSQRVRANELLCVLDPHDQPGKWFGIPAIGGGRDYDAIFAALAGVLDEMDRRYERYNVGENAFERLTVLIDEVPAIVLHDKKRWAEFVSQLGSEARKVNMSMVLLTQSPLVRDIEISSVMRNNFVRVALGDQIGDIVRDEPDRTRRQALDALLVGQSHPAAMEYRMEIHLLDTSDVPTLAKQRTPTARAWQPCSSVIRPTARDVLMKALRNAKEKGLTREQTRGMGLRFDNNDWSEV